MLLPGATSMKQSLLRPTSSLPSHSFMTSYTVALGRITWRNHPFNQTEIAESYASFSCLAISLHRQIMSMRVFLTFYVGMPRNHAGILVETNTDGSGELYHVHGTIQQGMSFGSRPAMKPEDDPTFVAKEYLGIVTLAKYPQINNICSHVPPPKKQYDGPKRLFPNEPLRRCGEWAEEAVQALRDAGVIQAAMPV